MVKCGGYLAGPCARTLGWGDVWLARANPREGVGINRMEGMPEWPDPDVMIRKADGRDEWETLT